MVTLTIEKRNDPTPFDADGMALVFPGMAGRAVGCVAMLVKQEDANQLYLAPSGWQTAEYRWLSGRVRNEGPDLIVPLEQSISQPVNEVARLRVILLDAGIEGVTAGRELTVPPRHDAETEPPPPRPLLPGPTHAASAPWWRSRAAASALALIAIVAVGIGVWKYGSSQLVPLQHAASSRSPELAATAPPTPAPAQAQEPERRPSTSTEPAQVPSTPTRSQVAVTTPGSEAFRRGIDALRGGDRDAADRAFNEGGNFACDYFDVAAKLFDPNASKINREFPPDGLKALQYYLKARADPSCREEAETRIRDLIEWARGHDSQTVLRWWNEHH